MTVREARVIMAADIAKNLFPDNSFVNDAINDDAWVSGSEVHLPQAGAIPTAVMDRSVFPVPVVTRQDIVKSYAIREASTAASRLAFKDKIAANYNMSQEVTDDHRMVLDLKASESVAFGWAATGNRVVKTTGVSRPAIATGATGNRLRITSDDILQIKRKMDAEEIPETDRVALLNSEMLNDLLLDNNLLGLWELGEKMKALGELTKLFGFTIKMRSTLLRYQNNLTPINMGADAPVLAATDLAGSLFWHKRFVRKAFSGVKVFLTLDDASYQGDLLSAVAYVGASPRYTNGRGVYSLVEGVPA